MTRHISSLGFALFRSSRTSTPTYAGVIYLIRDDGRTGSQRCPHRHRTVDAALRCVERDTRAEPRRQICQQCNRTVEATRSDARTQHHWEPYSFSTQHAIDHGPMVCPECVRKALDRVIHALKLS